jgi:hypothetical protein
MAKSIEQSSPRHPSVQQSSPRRRSLSAPLNNTQSRGESGNTDSNCSDPDLEVPKNFCSRFGEAIGEEHGDIDAIFGEINLTALLYLTNFTISFGGTGRPCPKHFRSDNSLLVASQPFPMYIQKDKKEDILAELSKLKTNIPIVAHTSEEYLTMSAIIVTNLAFVNILKRCGVESVVFNSYGMKGNLDEIDPNSQYDWGWSRMMNIVKLDPDADLFFDVGITIPTSKLHWARNTHGFKHENVIPLIRCTEPKSPSGSISKEIGRSAAVKNFPLYWIAQAELSCELPTFGTWSLYLDVSTSEHDPLAYLNKAKAYISTQHELKLNSNTSFASNELTCNLQRCKVSNDYLEETHRESGEV